MSALPVRNNEFAPDESELSRQKEQPGPEGTTILHLAQFAPGIMAPPQTSLPDNHGLTAFIQKAAEETVQNSNERIIVPRDAQALPPKEMLGVISYAYAKEVYESERIEGKMRKDPTIRETLGQNVPDANSIRKFRKLNRQAILQTIEKAFRLKRRKEKEELMQPLPGQPVTAVPGVVQDGEHTVLFSKQQAQQKVENAIIVDNMSKDD